MKALDLWIVSIGVVVSNSLFFHVPDGVLAGERALVIVQGAFLLLCWLGAHWRTWIPFRIRFEWREEEKWL